MEDERDDSCFEGLAGGWLLRRGRGGRRREEGFGSRRRSWEFGVEWERMEEKRKRPACVKIWRMFREDIARTNPREILARMLQGLVLTMSLRVILAKSRNSSSVPFLSLLSLLAIFTRCLPHDKVVGLVVIGFPHLHARCTCCVHLWKLLIFWC